MAKKVKKEKVQDAVFSASVISFGKTFTATGTSVSEAIQNIKCPNAKGKSILILEHNGKKQEKVLAHPMTARLFGAASPTIKAIILKQVAMRFDV